MTAERPAGTEVARSAGLVECTDLVPTRVLVRERTAECGGGGARGAGGIPDGAGTSNRKGGRVRAVLENPSLAVEPTAVDHQGEEAEEHTSGHQDAHEDGHGSALVVQESHPTHTNREVDDTVRLVATGRIAIGVIQVNGVDAVTTVVAPFAGTGQAVRVTVICPACIAAICATFGADA